MRKSRVSIPAYRLHKPSGKAVVRLNGRDYYLGTHGSPESHQEYERLIAEWLACGRQIPAEPVPDLTVSEVMKAYYDFARSYYPPTADTTSQADRVKYALVPVYRLYGPTEARKFGPLALKACRQWMMDHGQCRRYVNDNVGTIKRAFKWAVSEELIPGSVYEALRTVAGLQRGRSAVRETDPVQPVPEEHIEAAKKHTMPLIAGIIDFQLFTAARPGEVLRLRPCDIDRSGKVWIYRPSKHKTQYKGHERTVLLGPRAQTLLLPYLERDQNAYCFSPREAVEAYLRELGRKIHSSRKRMPGERYQSSSYTRAIAKACDRAEVPRWHGHQLRHNAATRIVEQFGWDAARIILGHRHVDVTRIYAEDNLAKAMEVIAKIG